ncbi:hypothetical protein AKJ16_DCAP19015 [Drosera capensis]
MECYAKFAARGGNSPFDCIMFDLDDTLYPFSAGISTACKRNIEDFLVERCGFPQSEASHLRVELFKTHGSTLAGLRALGYDIGADEYHSFVHGRLPYERIKPDPQLRSLLLSITQRKIIFTNSDLVHANKALKRLGIEDCFDEIICFETLNPNLSMATRPEEIPIVLKPSKEAIRIAISVGAVNPHRTLFLDDSLRNVVAGKALGLRTTLVGTTIKSSETDYTLDNIDNLAKVIPEIWVIGGSSSKAKEQKMKRTRSEIDMLVNPTTVVA